MSYSVICPSCHTENSGSALQCIKCQTSLIGIPRQKNPPSLSELMAQREIEPTTQTVSYKDTRIESVGHALWRSFRVSFIIFLLASLITAVICFLGGWRTLSDFGTGLIYSGVVLVFIAWFVFKGSLQFAESQTNPLNPMNTAMPGTQSERTRQSWRDYMEGMNSTAVLGVSIALCFGIGWLMISLAK